MDDEASASAMVNYFTNCVAQLRERSVYVQFSNHTALKTDQVDTFLVQKVQNTNSSLFPDPQ